MTVQRTLPGTPGHSLRQLESDLFHLIDSCQLSQTVKTTQSFHLLYRIAGTMSQMVGLRMCMSGRAVVDRGLEEEEKEEAEEERRSGRNFSSSKDWI